MTSQLWFLKLQGFDFVRLIYFYIYLQSFQSRSHCDDHESLTINEELIIKKLQQINTSKAGGPDNMPNWVLKTFSDILVYLQLPTSLIRTFVNVKFLRHGNWPM